MPFYADYLKRRSEDRKDVEVVVLQRVILGGRIGEDSLNALGYLLEHPTYPKAMTWFKIQRHVYLIRLVEPFIKDSFVSR